MLNLRTVENILFSFFIRGFLGCIMTIIFFNILTPISRHLVGNDIGFFIFIIYGVIFAFIISAIISWGNYKFRLITFIFIIIWCFINSKINLLDFFYTFYDNYMERHFEAYVIDQERGSDVGDNIYDAFVFLIFLISTIISSIIFIKYFKNIQMNKSNDKEKHKIL